jgi:hypothetical protein
MKECLSYAPSPFASESGFNFPLADVSNFASRHAEGAEKSRSENHRAFTLLDETHDNAELKSCQTFFCCPDAPWFLYFMK